MGQKVHPKGLRLGITTDWTATWYSNKSDYSKYLLNDHKIREYLRKSLKDASISDIIIGRANGVTEVTIQTAKPGIIIGSGGDNAKKLKETLSKLVDENIKVSIKEIRNPFTDAQVVAQGIAHQLENRVSFRMAQKRAIRNAMKNGAKGIKTLISGRLGGAEMARSEGYSEGNVPLHTLRADIDYALAEADTTYGKLGVKVWIYKGEVLPTKKDKGGKKHVDAKKNEI